MRFNGRSVPALFTMPLRVTSRWLVRVYVVVRQRRKGSSTHQIASTAPSTATAS